MKDISSGDMQGIYILHVLASKVSVLWYIGYRVRVLGGCLVGWLVGWVVDGLVG